MLRSLCNKKGVGLIEVLIAIFLTATGIMAVLSLQPQGWRTMAKADYLGRASGILYKTLENYETMSWVNSDYQEARMKNRLDSISKQSAFRNIVSACNK